MASPSEKLAESLDVLKLLQQGNRRVFRSEDLSRVHRERLVENGFLQEVMKGWLISSSPDAQAGESTPWHAAFWEFCARYCDERFGEQWYLSPEQSLFLHGERTVIPDQLVVHSPKATNNDVKLLFGTTLYDLKVAEMLPPAAFMVREGLRLFTPSAALVRVPESFFRLYALEIQVVMASIADASDLLRLLLSGGHSAKAGYLAKAFRQTGRPELADEILQTMKGAGYDVRESSPFVPGQIFQRPSRPSAPIVSRLEMLWQSMRGKVVASFPNAPRPPIDNAAYLRYVDEIYRTDAYHSLSIEGYSVTPALVERVRQGGWDPAHDAGDRRNRDALAARGYWQAFQLVKKEVEKVIVGGNPAALARASHNAWYRQLFQPCVIAGLIDPAALAGYRNAPVFLRGSRYVPPRWEAVRDAMPALFDLLEKEPEASVRAVLGHWLFGYIHPFPDGNGRMARFLMNVMLASGGYPWTVIRVIDRKSYLSALDHASIEMDIHPFTTFIVRRVQWRLEPHDLAFPAPMESLASGRDVVVFYGQDGAACVRCAITGEALDDHFGGGGKDRLEVFKANRQRIQQEIQRRYFAGDTELDGSILIRSGDLPDSQQPRPALQPTASDGGSLEAIPWSGVAPVVDTRQSVVVLKPTASNEGSLEGTPWRGEERSRPDPEESRELSPAPVVDTRQSVVVLQPTASNEGSLERMPWRGEERSRADAKEPIELSAAAAAAVAAVADTRQSGAVLQTTASDEGSMEGMPWRGEERSRPDLEESIELSVAVVEDTRQSEVVLQPTASEGGSLEGVPGSAEDCSRPDKEEPVEVSAAAGEDTEQSGAASQPTASDGGSLEGMPRSGEDRSRPDPEESVELPVAAVVETTRSEVASQPTASDGGSLEGMPRSGEDRSRPDPEESIELSAAVGEDTMQSGAVSQPTASDGGSLEGMPGSGEDRSEPDRAESIELSAGASEDSEQSGGALQLTVSDGGGSEGMPGSTEDRSRPNREESVELSAAAGEDTRQSEAAVHSTASDGGGPEGIALKIDPNLTQKLLPSGEPARTVTETTANELSLVTKPTL